MITPLSDQSLEVCIRAVLNGINRACSSALSRCTLVTVPLNVVKKASKKQNGREV
tara:strand:+ start:919 stop:1083 length:165 start_codon:yes stop_codon:yes gene_type:complete